VIATRAQEDRLVNNGHEVLLNSDGSVTLPNGARLNTSTANQFATDNGIVESLDLRDTTGRGFYTDSNGYTLRSNGINNWIFGTDGSLTIPGAISSSTGFVVESNESVTTPG